MAVNINSDIDNIAKLIYPGVRMKLDSYFNKIIEEQVSNFREILKEKYKHYTTKDLKIVIETLYATEGLNANIQVNIEEPKDV